VQAAFFTAEAQGRRGYLDIFTTCNTLLTPYTFTSYHLPLTTYHLPFTHAVKLLRITTVPISLQLLLGGQFRYMKEKGYDVYTISADGPEVKEVLKEEVEHIAVPFTRKITPIQDLICLIKLVRIVNRIKPDIIHTHTPKAGLLGMLAGWICRTPVRVHTVAGLPLMVASGIKRSVLVMAEQITYACAHRVYPNSQGLWKFIMEELKAAPEKVKVIGKGSSNGIDICAFNRSDELQGKAKAIRKKHGIEDNDIVFSFVGRIVQDKGVVELVESFKALTDLQLPATKGKAFLVMVGPFEEDLDPLPEDVVKFIQTDKRVILAGFQSDVRPWVMASDIFVFPSYREGFPNVVMQSCLLEVPCIVSDINGCNEIISRDITGLIVPVRDVKSLSSAMIELMKDEAKRQKFANAAKTYVSANFGRQYVWECIRKEYEQLSSIYIDKGRR
jgi:glycosyltransferase involved in cell wall biosynthesis